MVASVLGLKESEFCVHSIGEFSVFYKLLAFLDISPAGL